MDRFYLEVFLPRFSSLAVKDRTNILMNLLENCNSKAVLEMIGNTACINTEGGCLKKPSELINPNCAISKLYLEEEDVYPSKTFSKHLSKLESLGMREIFTETILEERVMFLHGRACNDQKIFNISQELLQCITRLWKECKKDTSESLQKLRDFCYIPTKKGNICRPREVWQESVEDFVSFSREIIDPVESYFFGNNKFYEDVGIQSSVSVEDIVEQLTGLSRKVAEKHKPENFHEYRRASRMIENNLDKLAEIYKDEKIETLKHLKIVQDGISRKFFTFEEVTFDDSDKDFLPFFLRVPKYLWSDQDGIREKKLKLFLTLGAKENLSIVDLTGILKKIHNSQDNEVLDQRKLDQVVSILGLLYSRAQEAGTKISDLEIYVPNESSVLKLSRDLYYNDAGWLPLKKYEGSYVNSILSRGIKRDMINVLMC